MVAPARGTPRERIGRTRERQAAVVRRAIDADRRREPFDDEVVRLALSHTPADRLALAQRLGGALPEDAPIALREAHVIAVARVGRRIDVTVPLFELTMVDSTWVPLARWLSSRGCTETRITIASD